MLRVLWPPAGCRPALETQVLAQRVMLIHHLPDVVSWASISPPGVSMTTGLCCPWSPSARSQVPPPSPAGLRQESSVEERRTEVIRSHSVRTCVLSNFWKV